VQNGSYSGYESLVNTIAQGVNINNGTMKFWFTEVDWNNQSPGNAADNLEELMRFAFARKDFGGILLWVWWQGNLWRDDLSSHLANTDFSTNATGRRWKKLKDTLWSTNASGSTAANGDYTFKGFFGTYEINIGQNTYKVDFLPDSTVVSIPITSIQKSLGEKSFWLNGEKALANLALHESDPVFLATYSVSGKLLSKIPLKSGTRLEPVSHPPAGCFIYRIQSDKKIFYTARGLRLGL
jgi:hypothetical protein